MTEKEYKWTVTQTDFNLTLHKLRQIGLREKTVIQKNHYYGLPSSPIQDMTVRVREIDGVYSLQTKRIRQTEDAYRVAEENHQEIANLPVILSAQQVGVEEDIEFEYQGVLTTIRHQFDWNSCCHVDFDQSRYIHQEDFEIELEFQESIPTDLLSMFSGFQKSSKSKYQRFFNAWQLHRFDDFAIMVRIRNVIAEVFGNTVSKIQPDVPLAQHGMDSLNMVQLIIELEKEFDFELPDYLFDFSVFKNLCKISQLVKFCMNHKMWGEGFEESVECRYKPADSNI